ncbi:MAG TPA: DUF2207 domain-containing protein [Candidatus Nanoarchaeia archaeon]|nr:DUF2207 domain-containing protein [Candidatus Nanoarchaeia archaeon]
MKPKHIVWISVFVFSFITFVGSGVSIAQAEEIINRFDSQITLDRDGLVHVQETIEYDFGTEEKHGIYRDIPLTSKDGPNLGIAVTGVQDESGNGLQTVTSVSNNVLRIRIGDPDVYVSGIKTYIISYNVYGAVRSFTDHDEFYWNVTGNEWPVAIKEVNTQVSLYSLVENMTTTCFTGASGSTDKNCTLVQNENGATFATTKSLAPNEGLTVAIGLPTGFIANAYSNPDSIPETVNGSTSLEKWWFVVPVLVFVLIFGLQIAFAIRAKRPGFHKVIIPKELKGQSVVTEFGPPENLAPIEIGALLDRTVDVTDISSVIMDLAVRGYLKIKYTTKEIKFWPDKKDFEFVKVKDGTGLTRPADKTIFDLLFTGRDSVSLSTLKQERTHFYTSISYVQTSTEKDLQARGYFESGDGLKKTQNRILISSAVIFLVGFFTFFFSAAGIIFFIATPIVLIFFSLWAAYRGKNKLSQKGIETMAKILGFKVFLEMTEKDRLAMMNAPKLEPETFERFLPYAMVFGVEEKWAATFEHLYQQVPNWYSDQNMAGVFSAHVFAQELTMLNSSFNKVYTATAPQSSGGSSSGFSGGSSGGGGGGGGGGSW